MMGSSSSSAQGFQSITVPSAPPPPPPGMRRSSLPFHPSVPSMPFHPNRGLMVAPEIRRTSTPGAQVSVFQFRRSDTWNESRDVTFCRILAAEEFLARMLEQDDIIRILSQREDREQLTPEVIKVMGLRGHLHGELIRIQTMLTENDPELKNISEFEISHSEVVARLREIRDEARRQRDFETQTDPNAQLTPAGVQTTTEGHETRERGVGTQGNFPPDVTPSGRWSSGENATQTEANTKGVSVGVTDGETYDDRLRNVSTETDMNTVHHEEELRLAERFSVLIAGGSKRLTSDEVNAVLGEHSRAVQALRNRHDRDRRELLRRLQQKRNDLETTRRRVEEDMTDTDRVKSPDSESGSSAKQHEANEIQDSLSEHDRPASGSHLSLDEVAKTLEEMRLRGELSAEAVSNILKQHKARLNEAELSTSRNRTNRRKSNAHDQSSIDDAVNKLVKDTQHQKEQIQMRKTTQKELIDRKLRAKLNMTKESEDGRLL